MDKAKVEKLTGLYERVYWYTLKNKWNDAATIALDAIAPLDTVQAILDTLIADGLVYSLHGRCPQDGQDYILYRKAP